MGVVYFALNYILSRCTECENVIVGEAPVCPDCHGTTFDRFTRVVGFITPVRNWKKERREEFVKRTRYEVEKEITV
jgi:anaerobic ribonucleoside-triphosphate reductase